MFNFISQEAAAVKQKCLTEAASRSETSGRNAARIASGPFAEKAEAEAPKDSAASLGSGSSQTECTGSNACASRLRNEDCNQQQCRLQLRTASPEAVGGSGS